MGHSATWAEDWVASDVANTERCARLDDAIASRVLLIRVAACRLSSRDDECCASATVLRIRVVISHAREHVEGIAASFSMDHQLQKLQLPATRNDTQVIRPCVS
jgi:hypothetical protein